MLEQWLLERLVRLRQLCKATERTFTTVGIRLLGDHAFRGAMYYRGLKLGSWLRCWALSLNPLRSQRQAPKVLLLSHGWAHGIPITMRVQNWEDEFSEYAPRETQRERVPPFSLALQPWAVTCVDLAPETNPDVVVNLEKHGAVREALNGNVRYDCIVMCLCRCCTSNVLYHLDGLLSVLQPLLAPGGRMLLKTMAFPACPAPYAARLYGSAGNGIFLNGGYCDEAFPAVLVRAGLRQDVSTTVHLVCESAPSSNSSGQNYYSIPLHPLEPVGAPPREFRRMRSLLSGALHKRGYNVRFEEGQLARKTPIPNST